MENDSFSTPTKVLNGVGVLVHTSFGLFYGTLEKYDTRYGTALLSQGYRLPNYGYTTLENRVYFEDQSGMMPDDISSLKEYPLPTITDLAAEGVLVLMAEDIIMETSHLAPISQISLTGVNVIVPVGDKKAFENPAFLNADGTIRHGEDGVNLQVQWAEQLPRRAPRFKFSMLGIRLGDKLVFEPTGDEVIVISDDKISFQEKNYSMSSYARIFMPDDKRNQSGAYQGPAYFLYNGKNLTELRHETQDEMGIKDR